MRGRASTPEGHVLRAVLDLCAAERILAFRLNTGSAVAEHNGRKRRIRFGVPGMADAVCFPYGWVLWVEVKSETGRQRPEQKTFQAQVEEAGHAYLVVRSPEDLIAWLRERIAPLQVRSKGV